MTDYLTELNSIAQAIFDKKGFNILAIDARDVSTMADFFIIAEGTVDRHLQAICSFVCEKLKITKRLPLRIEGEKEGDWIVIDFGDLVIHLFTPDLREKYNIESIWKEGKIVDIKINVQNRPSQKENYE